MNKTFSKKVMLSNKRGLHARASAKFVKLAEQFSTTRISVQNDKFEVSALSIMGLMMLGASCGTYITISASDSNETLAMNSINQLKNLLDSKFGEDE